MCDYDALERKIKDSGYKQYYIAKRMGLSESGLSNKLNGRTQFKLDEVTTLARMLNLSGEELLQIFFKKVHVDFNIYQKGATP